ncbi:putative metalloprotease CJM1_0395 family protein [Shewanella donghaensis]|uniref:putative metalloprotease CJM1_0395 family protein n=1 Tax=Shewanella donghaensis TaxID=238836 RepID=UPI00221FC36F|nr:putative metalloprotease CJM1_0395 family protein [Shewanella donghaensis]
MGSVPTSSKVISTTVLSSTVISSSVSNKATNTALSSLLTATNSATSSASNNSSQSSQVNQTSSPQFNLRTGAISVAGLSVNNVPGNQSEVQTPSSQSQAEIFQPKNNQSTNTASDSKIIEPDKSETSVIFANESQSDDKAPSDIAQSEKVQAEQAQQEQKDQQEQAQQENINQQQAVELQVINDLKSRDIEVKTHEQAHATVGGSFAQSPTYTYEKGPDGKRYAVEGEVSIDVAPIEGDPQATYTKMQKVYAAAMAPVQPSSADIRVATEATQLMNEAKQELVGERQEQVISTEDVQHINDLGQIFNLAIDDLHVNADIIENKPNMSILSDFPSINIAV